MDEENLTQIGFEVDLDGLQTQLAEAEQRAQTALQRMGELQAGGELPNTVITAPAGAPPPTPPPPSPPPGAPGAPDPNPAESAGLPTSPKTKQQPDPDPVNPFEQAKAELEKIKAIASQAPDVALAGLMGQGGLQHRVAKAAVADPDNAEAWQELLVAIKEQTKATREQVRKAEGGGGGDPATGILNFLRGNALVSAAGTVGNNLTSGNLVGTATSGAGALLGFMMGGPIGAQAGATLGNMAGAGINSLLGGAGEAQQYSIMSADIAARFGDIEGVDEALNIDNIRDMDTSGYNIQETAQLFDLMRQSRLIDGVNDESKELVESIQELTRATGMNTEALVNQYSSYKTLGGEQSAEGYMAQMIAGAIAVGMRENLQEYGELMGSARMQLVYRGGIGDTGDEALKAIQGTLANLMGPESRTSDLLRDNPMMAQQLLGTLLNDGAAKQYSFDSAAMQLTGIDRGKTDEAYLDPEQQVNNAIARYQYVFQQFLGSGGLDLLGMGSVEELQAGVAQNPNLLQEKVTSLNPNSEQAAALQDLINMLFSAQFGQMPTSQNVNLFNQLGTSYLQNGTLSPETITPDGQTLTQMIQEMDQTEGDKAREAEQERHDEMIKLMAPLAPLLTDIQELAVDLLVGVNDGVDELKEIAKNLKPIADTVGRISNAISTFVTGRTGVLGAAQTALSATPIGPAMQSAEIAQNLFGDARDILFGSDPENAEVATDSGITFNSTSEIASNIFNSNSILNPLNTAQILTNPFGVIRDALQGDRPTQPQSNDRSEQPQSSDRPANAATALNSDLSQFLNGGAATEVPDDVFNDTPPGGVMATENYNTFQFAPGDLVTANQTRNTANYQSTSAPVTLTIQQTITVGSGTDTQSVQDAARSGAQSGFDEFLDQWENRLNARNSPRINDRLY